MSKEQRLAQRSDCFIFTARTETGSIFMPFPSEKRPNHPTAGPLLLEYGAKADIRLAGITWGKDFEWETTLLDVTPLSYAH